MATIIKDNNRGILDEMARMPRKGMVRKEAR